MSTDYKQLLNQPQYEAVTYNDGPSLIVAGAGSGKTRVLTYKISYLIENGFPASSILALTFTNKAAREMKERIAKVVGEKFSRYLWMGTFHSIFSRILRAEAEKIGFTRDFTIYDAADSKGLIRDIIKEMELDEKKYKVKAMVSRISTAKNNLIPAEMYAADEQMKQEDYQYGIPRFHELYSKYSRRCKVSNAMDFDDLLLYTNTLFVEHPEVLQHYQERFKYILVDEYQDTNRVQHRIVSLLAKMHNRICVVGDDAQSIYSFRGACIGNMLQFQSSFPGCKLFKLEQNYRSTQTIVNAANALIENNRHQIRKNVFSELEVGKKILVMKAPTDIVEAETIAKQIKRIVRDLRMKHAELHPYSQIAVLYRTNAQSRSLEKRFREENIPYRIYGGLSFYQRKEIKDVLAYMRLVINAEDEEAFKRIINYPARKIGAVTQNKILEAAHHYDISPLTVIKDLAGHGVALSGATAQRVHGFNELIEMFSEESQKADAYSVAEIIIERSGIAADIASDTDPDNAERRRNVQELLTAINEYCEERVNQGINDISLHDFLSEVSLLTDQDENDKEDTDYVTLMTIHSAKGLEFPHLFIAGVEEGLMPLSGDENPSELEEERRLCYVALTRAKESCCMSYSQLRFRNGMYEEARPSRFIDEIGEQYLQLPTSYVPSFNTRSRSNFRTPSPVASVPVSDALSRRNTTSTFRPIASVPHSSGNLADASKIQAGIKVRHANFGEGVVLSVEGTDASSRKAVIRFQTSGERTLLLKYAKLEIIQ